MECHRYRDSCSAELQSNFAYRERCEAVGEDSIFPKADKPGLNEQDDANSWLTSAR